MLVRRSAGLAGLVLGLCVLGTPGWADEPTQDPQCSGQVEPPPGDGEVTAEPAPVEEPPAEEAPVEEPPAEEPQPTEEPQATDGPSPEETVEPPVEATEEPVPDDASPGPSYIVVCSVEQAVQVTGGEGTATVELPRTGESSVGLLGLGAGMVLLGGGAVVAGRRSGRT
jgi:LPXTG-motif cell wall-anchored protein